MKESRRVTVLLDSDLDKKLRLLQAKLIQKNNESISFSQVLNHAIREYFN